MKAETFNLKMERYRYAQPVLQNELADEIPGWSRNTVIDIEQGRVVLPPEQYQAVRDAIRRIADVKGTVGS